MNKGTLLIVDDEPIILKMLKFNLDELADTILIANNGLEALEVLKENEVHCIICDINMPKMNGVEVIKSLRKDDNNVPFIFYTAHGNQDLMMEAVKYGAFDFLNKPGLEGLEDVVTRGLTEGLGRLNEGEVDEDVFLSDYQKLINNLSDSD